MKVINKLPLVLTLISPILLFGCVATVDGPYVVDNGYPVETVSTGIVVDPVLPLYVNNGYGYGYGYGGWRHHGWRHHGGWHHGGHRGGHRR